MLVLNDLDRFHLVGDVVDHAPKLKNKAAYIKQMIRDKLTTHREYIRKYGQDMPDIREWKWKAQ